MAPNMIDHVEDEMKWLLKARFTRPIRYDERIPNIVLVIKKNNGKLKVWIYFESLNLVTLKDEYQIPMVICLLVQYLVMKSSSLWIIIHAIIISLL